MRLWMCATEWSATDSTTFTVCAVTDCCCDDNDDRMPTTTTTTTMWRWRKGNHKNATNTYNHTCARCDSSTLLYGCTAYKRYFATAALHTTQTSNYTPNTRRWCTVAIEWTITLLICDIFFFAFLTSFPCVFLSVRMSKWHFSIYLPPFVTHTPYCLNVAHWVHKVR